VPSFGVDLQSNVVRRLQPRLRPFEDAISAFRNADFDDCLGVLNQHHAPHAIALRARALIRLGLPSEALEVLREVADPSLSHRYASELSILEVTALIVLDDIDGAETAMCNAKARSYGVGSVELESELVYLSALLEWTQGKYAEARIIADSLLAKQTSIPAWLREHVEYYPFNAGYWRARTYELLGMTAALEKNYALQAEELMHAVQEFDSAKCPDVFVEAAMLSNLAVLVRDLQVPDVVEFVRDRLATMTWPDAVANRRFYAQDAIGWCSALSGDHLGGLREFRQSAEIAPSIPLKISAILNRAFIAAQLSERYFAWEQLEHAFQLASTVDWESVVNSDRKVLLDLAAAIAPHDARRARIMLDRFMSARTPISKLSLFSQDTRRRGDECMATAAVVRAEGALDRAVMVYKEAFDIWTDVGYAWRAAAAALEIYTLTGDTAYLDVVAREAAERPLSWIANRYASVVLDDPRSFVRA
jgi:tetratricopeptide (TPR) repeat protein